VSVVHDAAASTERKSFPPAAAYTTCGADAETATDVTGG
jgi:hypothetical protein